MLISEKYTEDLKYLIYGQGYDIRIHALQTSLLILDVKYYNELNINDINFGYHCSITENIVTEYQRYNKLNIDGKINLDTWNSIFNQLKVLKRCTIIQTGPRSIEVIGTNELLEGSNVNDTSSEESNISSSIDGTTNGDVFSNAVSDNISYEESLSGKSYLDIMNNYSTDSKDTSYFDFQYNKANGGKSFDELVYNYIVSGGKVYNNASYSYNINGSESWDYKYITPIIFNSNGSSNKDYDYIYNLLSNSIYEGNLNLSPMEVSFSNTDNVGKFINPFAKSTNKPYFSPYSDVGFKNDALKNSKFDITIVYGPKGSKARKIIEVTPMAVSQEINASGEPIYDLYEFIAKDVVDGM